jgi:hypothetical protein
MEKGLETFSVVFIILKVYKDTLCPLHCQDTPVVINSVELPNIIAVIFTSWPKLTQTQQIQQLRRIIDDFLNTH